MGSTNESAKAEHPATPGKLRTLVELMHGQRLRYAAAIGALGLGTAFLYLSPLIVGGTIDALLETKPTEKAGFIRRMFDSLGGAEHLGRNLALAASAVVAVTALGGFFTYLKGRWSALASEAIAKRLRERLYDHLQHVPATYHDKASTGDLVQRCTSDVDTLRLFYFSQVTEVARAVLLVAIVLPILITMDWPLALAAMAVLPVIVVFALLFFSRVHGSYKAMDEAEGQMTAALQENLTGIRVVRAFARQEFEKDKFEKKNAGHRDLHWKLYKIMAAYWSFSDLLCFAQMACVVFYGAYRMKQGMTAGTLVTFIACAQMYIWPVRQMGRIVTELGKAMVSVGRVKEVLEVEEEKDGEVGKWGSGERALPERVGGEIVFAGVSFAHGEKEVLHEVSIEVPPGQTLALLGPSGAGKSTLVNLLLRIYDYQRGSITLDGMEVNTLPRKYVRSQLGVVMQEPFLYSKTVGENIRLSRHTAEEGEIVEAAQVAAVHESIVSFEKQYETLVGERGVTLSGGQRQRVAIARALLRDAPVLVLDDALSAVDTHTEAGILDALKSRRGKHTTIVIAHRLSTLMHADQIVVLEHGRITQRGTHEQLVSQEGLYRRLWQIQGALEEDLRNEMADETTVADERDAEESVA